MAKSQLWIKRSMVAIVMATSAICIAQTALNADQLNSGPSRSIVLQSCIIRPLNQAKIPAQEKGVIESIKVTEGSQVKAGEVLAVVNDKIARLELETAILQSENLEPIKSAAAKEEEVAARYDDAVKLKNLESKEKKRLYKASLDVAISEHNDEKIKLQQTKIKSKVVEETLNRHKIVSPINGDVVEKMRNVGEAVEALEEVFVVIELDKVKVTGSLPLRDADYVRPGMAVQVYPNEPGRELQKLVGHTDEVLAIKFMPDANRIVSSCRDGTIILWNRANNRRERSWAQSEDAVHALAIHPSTPNRVISGGADQCIRVWDIEKAEPVATLPKSGSPIFAIALDPNNPNICATGHQDRTIRIWDLKEGTVKGQLSGHTNLVTSLAFTPDGTKLLSTGGDQTDRIWDIAKMAEIRAIKGRSLTLSSQISLSVNGEAYYFDGYPTAEIRQLSDDLTLAYFDLGAPNPTGIAVFSPTNGYLATSNANGEILLWAPPNSPEEHTRLVRTYEGHKQNVMCLDFSPDGTAIVTGGGDRAVRIWEVPPLETVVKELHTGKVTFVSPQAEPGAPTVEMHAVVENPDRTLRPNTSATLIIKPNSGAKPTGAVKAAGK